MPDPESKLYAKICEVIEEVEEVAKTGHNDHFHYDYATAEEVLRVIRAPLATRRVIVLPSLQAIEERTYTSVNRQGEARESTITTAHIRYTFIDCDTGEREECEWAGQGDDPSDKGWGKSATNAAKTFLRTAFLLPQGDDSEADGHADERSQGRVGSASRYQKGGGLKPSDGQAEYIEKLVKQKKPTIAQLKAILSEVGATVEIEEGWVKKYLTGGREGSASHLIERLKSGPLPDVPSLETPPSDVPNDDVPAHAPAGDTSDVPFTETAA